MSRRFAPSRRAFLILATLCTTACALLAAPFAQASPAHRLDTAHSPFGSFNFPLGISVDDSTNLSDLSAGDVYVDDFNNGRVVKLDPDGEQIGEITGLSNPAWSSVDPSNGDLYVGDYTGNSIDKFDSSGSPVTAWATNGKFSVSSPAGLAVSPATGDLYAGSRGPSVIRILDSQGSEIAQFTPSISGSLDSVAVDGSGDVFVTEEDHNVTEYKPSENPPTSTTTFDSGTVIDANGAGAVAIDPVTEDVYVTETTPKSQIAVFEPNGTRIGIFGAGQIGNSLGIALNREDAAYVTDSSSNDADIFVPPSIPQVLTVEKTGSGEITSNPAGIECGPICSAEFEKGEAVALTAKSTERSTLEGWEGCDNINGSECEITLSASKSVKATFEAIPQRKLSVITTEGTGEGNVFASPPGSEFTPIDCGNGAEACEAEYNQGATLFLFATPAEHSVFTGWTGCNNVVGSECEVTMSAAKSVKAKFNALPTSTTGEAVEITNTAATLQGSVNPRDSKVEECAFEYVTEAAFTETGFSDLSSGGTASCEEPDAAEVGAATSPVEVHAAVSHLKPATAYRFRLLAKNEYGIDHGAEPTFETLPAVQELTTEPATDVAGTSADLHASFYGVSEETEYFFEWGRGGAEYERITPTGTEVKPEGHTLLSFEITNLLPASAYHFRIVATNPVGTTIANEELFETPTLPAIAPLPTTEFSLPKTTSETTSATINARVSPENGGNVTACHFEYGPQAGEYTSGPLACMVGAPGEETEVGTPTNPIESATAVHAHLAGLSIGATYHYRLTATSHAGTTIQADQTFTTIPLPPTVDATSASVVTEDAATLQAQINPGFGPTAYIFEYGTTTSYTQRSQSTFRSPPLPAEGTDQPAAAALTGLTPDTTYHYRVLAINLAATTAGPDRTFTTTDAPGVLATSAANLTPTAATLQAQINPHLAATTYHFEFGPTTSYGQSTPQSALGSDNTADPATATLTGLTPDTTYHYRVLAANSEGQAAGPDQTFTTPPIEEKKATPPLTCRKGFVKKHGRCVKKPKPHHKKKHHKRVRHERSKKHRAKKGSVHS